jgi:AcrR family transcriptional regulator
LVAAEQCLRADGVDASMTLIAETSGYSIGTVYQYFPDRRSLLCELQSRVAEATLAEVVREIPAFVELPLDEGVARVLRVIVRSAAEHRALTAVVHRDIVPAASEGEWEDLLPRFSEILAAQLRGKRDVRSCDLEVAVFFVLQSVEAIVERTAIEHPAWLDEQVFFEELCRLVTGYLRA